MPGAVKPNACSGQKDGPTCFYARSINQWEYPCKKCGVKAETLCSKKTFTQWCIRCFYAHEDNKNDRCKGEGCMKAMRDVKEKQEKMKMDASLSDSLETIAAPTAAASSNPQQMIEKLQDDAGILRIWVQDIQQQVDNEVMLLKDEVGELRHQVKLMWTHIDKLNASGWNSWQGQWEGSTSGPSTAATPWNEGSTSGPSAAAQ